MAELRFTWDPNKACQNLEKHGVSFEEAEAVCHCVRASGDEIRIISARKAVKAEQKQYWERLRR